MTTNPKTVRARLTRLRDKLEDFEWKLRYIHEDRSGMQKLYRGAPPLLRTELQSTLAGIARTEREALGGCLTSANWLADTAELRARVEYLNSKPLKDRDPDYSGPMSLWPERIPPRPAKGGSVRRAGEPIPLTPAQIAVGAADFDLEDLTDDEHWYAPRRPR